MTSCYDPEIAKPATKMNEDRLDRKNYSTSSPVSDQIARVVIADCGKKSYAS
jgi:hypothetical protein